MIPGNLSLHSNSTTLTDVIRKKLNADQRRTKQAGELATFVQQYARKAYPNWDPNDRRYDREIEKHAKRMNPEELDRLLREDD